MFDYVVIGGGVVGCAIFNSLVLSGKNCALIEKENDIATGCSKANSGLIHAGFDAKPNTLKAKLNVEGNKLIPSVCKRLGIKYKKTGAIVVGDDYDAIKKLFERGKTNGVKNLKILNQQQTKKLCPNLTKNCKYSLFAKDAGIISPYMLTIALCEEAIINGGTLFLNENITKIEKKKDFTIFCNKKIQTKNIINASGFGFNDVSTLIGAETYDLQFRRGQYYVLDKSIKPFVNLSVFPLPTKLGKGILATPTIDGNTLLGPTADDGENNTQTTAQGLEKIREYIKENFGVFPSKDVIREFSGVRCFCGDDFVIQKSKIVSGVVNVAGICSPGLSSAVAIGEYVKNMLGETGKLVNAKKRKPYTCIQELSTTKKNKLIKLNPNYGKIICRCELVSLGEIEEVLSGPIKVSSVDAIKRRLRAGMGRCQGSFCGSRILQIISAKRHIAMTEVCKEHIGSNVVKYEAKFGGKNEK